jgi:hypothetical protein
MLAAVVVGLLAAGQANDTYVMLRECQGSRTTIHGLWPEWCAGPPFSPTALEPVASRLQQWWSSCEGDDNATAFHEHEWAKHGRCTELTQLAYFTTALDLRDTYPPPPQLRVCLDRVFAPFSCPPRGGREIHVPKEPKHRADKPP